MDSIDSGHHHCHEGWIQLHCPFCAGGVSGFHLGFSLESGYFNCWRCGGHSVWSYLGEILRTSDRSKIYKVLQKYQMDSPGIPRTRRHRSVLVPPPHLESLSHQHRSYLRRRGFRSREIEREWGLEGTRHLSGKWNWRVVGTICNRFGVPVAHIGRSISSRAKPKYRITDKQDCAEDPNGFLYGIHNVPGDSIVVVEGPADVWRLGPGSVATLGIDWTVTQANLIRQFKHRFVCYDPDQNAQRSARRLAEWLSAYPGSTELVDDMPCDPGDLEPLEAKSLMGALIFNRQD